MSWELIGLGAFLGLFGLLGLFLLFRRRLGRLLRRKQDLFVKDVINFQKAQTSGQKEPVSVKSSRKEIPGNAYERNHSFLTINRDLSEQEKSGMMSFSLNSNLQLDTVQQTEENDAARIDLELERELRGGYLDTHSAKNSTKNATRKEIFLEFKKKDSTMDEEVSYEIEADEPISDEDGQEPPLDLKPCKLGSGDKSQPSMSMPDDEKQGVEDQSRTDSQQALFRATTSSVTN